MHLRAEGSFQEGVNKIITSTERHDAIAKWMPPDGKGKGKDADGKGKSKDWLGKGKFRTPAPYTPAGPSRPPCRLFANGFCKYGAACKFSRAGTGTANTATRSGTASPGLGTAQGVRQPGSGDTWACSVRQHFRFPVRSNSKLSVSFCPSTMPCRARLSPLDSV